MHEYKKVKYHLNAVYKVFGKNEQQWFYAPSGQKHLKPLKAKTFETAQKEVHEKIDEALKNRLKK